MGLITIEVSPPFYGDEPTSHDFYHRVEYDDMGFPRYVISEIPEVRDDAGNIVEARTPLVHIHDLTDSKRLREVRWKHNIDKKQARKSR